MKFHSSCVAGLLVIASIAQAKWSPYHLPWACSVVDNEGRLVGACSIFDETKVLVSSDNFNVDVKLLNNKVKKYFEIIENLYVYAGSNLMDSDKLKTWEAPVSAQVKRAKSLVVAARRRKGKQTRQTKQKILWWYLTSPRDIGPSKGYVEYDHYGIAFNIGILSVEKPFRWTDHVKPIVIPNGATIKTMDFINQHEAPVWLQLGDTCVTYSWNHKTNKIRYHEVTYLPRADCLNVFCMWNLSTCDLFPKQAYHTCFKSVTYQDVCPSARGAALYCPSYSKSVFAILTTAPSCGQRHMPGVYTTLPWLIELYETVFNTTFDVSQRPQYEPLGLDQGYSPWG